MYRSGSPQLDFLRLACLVAVNPTRSACVVCYDAADVESDPIRLLWGDVELGIPREEPDGLDRLVGRRVEEIGSLLIFTGTGMNGTSMDDVMESTFKLWDIPGCPSAFWNMFGGSWSLGGLEHYGLRKLACEAPEMDAPRMRILPVVFGGTTCMEWRPAEVSRLWIGPGSGFEEACKKAVSAARVAYVPGSEYEKRVDSALSRGLEGWASKIPWFFNLDKAFSRCLCCRAPVLPETEKELDKIRRDCESAGFPVDGIWRNWKDGNH